jgi:putative Holliday junction resolvase
VTTRTQPSKGVLLGFDYGTVRIGLAVTDPDRIIASPHETYTRQSDEADARHFARIAQDVRAVGLVVGLPLHADGQESDKSREARLYGKWLSGVLSLAVVFWDERFTTALADDVLAAGRVSGKKRRQQRDRLAAQLMLQSFIDAGSPPEGTIPIA